MTNWPLAVGVEIALLVVGIFMELVMASYSLSEPELELEDREERPARGSDSILVNASVVTQNKKFPKILPWGDPPGSVLGYDLAL